MATTKTDICNLALSLLGDEALQLTDVAVDDTKISRQCLLHYDFTLAELLRMHTWNCAIQRDQLTTSAYTEHGWQYKASWPAGCVRPLALTDSDSYLKYPVTIRTEWVVSGREILTNVANPYLTFVGTPTIANMDSLFLQAFYTLLAVKLCIPITGTDGLAIRKTLVEEFNFAIMPEARRVNSFEGFEEPVVDSDWLSATMSPGSGNRNWMALSVGDIAM
jgi:hypothetical protein